MHDPQRFALEHEAAKAKQAAILQRRRNGLEQRLGSPRRDQSVGQYQLPDPVAARQRRTVVGDFAMDTSHAARPEYSESAYTTFAFPRDSVPTEARAPRYALDAFGRAYEVDEYGNSVARELVQLELAPFRDSRLSTSGAAPRLPSPFQFGHPTLSRSLYSGQHNPAPITHQYRFSDEETHVSHEYDPRFPLLSQDAGTAWNQSGRSASHGRAHSSDDRRITLPSSSVEWQPASSAYYQAQYSHYLARSDSPVRLPSTAGTTDFYGARGSQASMSATLSHAHAHAQDDSSTALPSRAPSLRTGAPPSEGTSWLRSSPGEQVVQNRSAHASAPLPPRDPDQHPRQHTTDAHNLTPLLMQHSDPSSGTPSSAFSSSKTTVKRASVSPHDSDSASSPVQECQATTDPHAQTVPDRLRDAESVLECDEPE